MMMPRALLLLALARPAAAYAPLFDAFGQPGGDEQKCSGAQVLRTGRDAIAKYTNQDMINYGNFKHGIFEDLFEDVVTRQP